MDEYPPGVRAPGERYTGPIADPDEAMRAAMASQDVSAQAAKYAADPDAPIRAYLSAMEVWKDPGKYAGYLRPGAVVSVPPLVSPHGQQARGSTTPAPVVPVAAPTPATVSGVEAAERPDLAVIRARYQVAGDPMVMYRPRVGSTPIPGPGPERLTATEAKMIDGLDPLRLLLLARSRRRAYTMSEVYVPTPGNITYPPGVVTDRDKRDWLTNGGHRDAFRHAYWNALMARDLGQDWTEQFATAHEAVPGNPGDFEAMDLYNNSIGRRIAAEHPGASNGTLARRVNEALRKGELIVLDEAGNLQWSDRTRPWQHGLSNGVPDDGERPVPAGDAPAQSR